MRFYPLAFLRNRTMEMESKSFPSLLLLFLLSLLLQRPAFAAKNSYIVYFGGHSHNSEEASLLSPDRVVDTHREFLGSVLGSKEKAQDAIFYSYTRSINGFAANLDEEEAMEISKRPGVISVFRNRGYKLHTTHSWDFMGLERNGVIPEGSLWTKSRFGEDVIIGNLDTGVWPESESFNDDDMGPIPSNWKGICQNKTDKQFLCNRKCTLRQVGHVMGNPHAHAKSYGFDIIFQNPRKLIGARYFNEGYKSVVGPLSPELNSPRDTEGHGTHTLSTAAGRMVPGATLFGYGTGMAKGGSPNARVAAYKVCWPPVGGVECLDSDILAGFDAAIYDGVHVLSVSLGGDPVDYLSDGIAIGSFHAVKRGITVVFSAGNSGPTLGTVSNVAPWMLTVGASTIDREFVSYVQLRNRKQLKGQSLSTIGLQQKFYPLISSKEAKATNASLEDATLCLVGSLDPAKVRGKIVACLRGNNARIAKGEAVRQAGGVGMILANDESTGNEIIADAHVLPATHISYSDGVSLFSYLNKAKSPLGYITNPETRLDTYPAPVMAAFSSRGPNTVNPEIIKPDITAPGVSIIAAYTGASGPSTLTFDSRRVLFNSESGTSMSCPHISGIVGLLKALHPDWSPSAIKSAIMTSARTQDNTLESMSNSTFGKADPFSYGSGHVRPNRAMDPGLVYDLTTNDYLNFLCSLGYNSTQISLFNEKPYLCPSRPLKIENLNYPSISLPYLSGSASVIRTVKNVGTPGTYRVRVIEPAGISVSVKPTSLKFTKFGEEKKFMVTLKSKSRDKAGDLAFGKLIWSDGKHYVRSPIVAKTG